MDDIAERLKKVIDRYGPEAFAVGQSNASGLGDSGLCRRFMNHIGSPNWISGVAYCAGNTAAVNRYVYGWFPRGDILNSKCIVLIGHDPRRHSWTMEYKAIRMAQARGAKLIVLDPRRSENAERADIWLPLRAGTDAAMTLGWLNVIVEEELYDKEFVRDWTVGFDALVERLKEYPVERVARITGVPEERIRAAARLYATTSPACIPWTPITDQQVSSTSAIRIQCMLRGAHRQPRRQGRRRLRRLQPGRARRLRDRDAPSHLRGAEGEAARLRRASGLHLSRQWRPLKRADRAGLGRALREPRERLLHGEPDGRLQGHGGRQALPGQGLLRAREQRADGVRQHAARVRRADEPGPHRRLRARPCRRPRRSRTTCSPATPGWNGRPCRPASASRRWSRPENAATS